MPFLGLLLGYLSPHTSNHPPQTHSGLPDVIGVQADGCLHGEQGQHLWGGVEERSQKLGKVHRVNSHGPLPPLFLSASPHFPLTSTPPTHLHQVVLDNITHDPVLIKVTAATLRAEILLETNLDVGDVVPVPAVQCISTSGVQYSVAKKVAAGRSLRS